MDKPPEIVVFQRRIKRRRHGGLDLVGHLRKGRGQLCLNRVSNRFEPCHQFKIGQLRQDRAEKLIWGKACNPGRIFTREIAEAVGVKQVIFEREPCPARVFAVWTPCHLYLPRAAPIRLYMVVLVAPPSSKMFWPTMKPACCEHIKAQVAPNSAGVP